MILVSVFGCGLVAQETVLFNDTIRVNVSYGNPDADDAMIKEALKAAQLTEFVARQSGGLETEVGERGILELCPLTRFFLLLVSLYVFWCGCKCMYLSVSSLTLLFSFPRFLLEWRFAIEWWREATGRDCEDGLEGPEDRST